MKAMTGKMTENLSKQTKIVQLTRKWQKWTKSDHKLTKTGKKW